MPTLSGRVFEDTDGSGDYTAGDIAASVTVEIRTLDGATTITATTDGDGLWSASVPAGEWVVSIIAPDGWAATCLTGTRSYAASVTTTDLTGIDFALLELADGSVASRFCVQVLVYGIEPLTSTLDGLVLGHVTRGRIGAAYFSRLRSGDANTPTDITDFVESIDISRGRRRALDSFDASSCTIIVESTDQRFDQLHGEGAYSIELATGSNKQLFRRGRAVRVVVSGTSDGGMPLTWSLWSGWIESISTAYSPTVAGIHQATTITCTDAFGLAGRVDRNEADVPYGAGETMGPRIRRWAEAAGLMLEGAASTLTARPPGYYALGGLEQPSFFGGGTWRYGVVGDEGTKPLQSTYLSENALTAMKAAAASEDAFLYVNSDGQIVHQVRGSTPDVPDWGADAPRFSDSDTGAAITLVLASGQELTLTNGEIETEGIPRISTDTTDVANYVSLARSGGTARVKVDSATTDVVGRVAYSRTDLINNNDADVDAIAAAILARHASEAKTIVSDVVTKPYHSDSAMAAAMHIEPTTPVWFMHSVVMPAQRQFYVQGIEHSIKPNLDWTATYTLSEVQ